MAEDRGLDILDYLLFVVRWKKLLLSLGLAVAVLTYLGVYVLIPEEFEATATIVPAEDTSLGALSALMRNFSSLPMGLGGAKKTTEMDRYTTIIMSRSTVEGMIDHFRLDTLYRFENREAAVKAVRKMITTTITMENAYELKVRARRPQLAADLTNYLVRRVNDKIVELNVGKSHDNRLFLEQRYAEIRQDLQRAEDSLKVFQQKYGVFEAKEQVRSTLAALTKLESEQAVKQVELALVKNVYGTSSPQYANAHVSLAEFTSKLEDLRKGRDPASLLIPIDKIPAQGLAYFRLFRRVEIGNKLLEFIIPLYEQAKFEEKKDTPILQVIDDAVPPLKKAYPQRLFLTLVITVAAMLITLLALILREVVRGSASPRVALLRAEAFRFRGRS
jgi:capsule polysaccharide export protein KpsE/RkpR